MTLGVSDDHADGRAQDAVAASRLFIHLAFIVAICLQRFGVVVGDGGAFLSLPVFAGMILWAYLNGYGELRTSVSMLYVVFSAWTLFGTLMALLVPDARFGVSLTSIMAILVNYALVIIGPTRRFDRAQVLPIFLFYVRLCAILGIAQYLAQFVGVKIFSFMVTVPALKPFLIERLFNFAPVLAYGSTIMRSNGFFLVEPSVFSQLLAAAFAIELFMFGRKLYLPLYGVAYLLTSSGTGLLILGVSIAIFMIFDWRNIGRLAVSVLMGAAVVAAASVILPDQIASITNRAGEVNATGSSGYARYMAQFDMIGRYGSEMRGLIGWGPGALERADGFMPGSGNPSLKLFFDYGLLGLGIFWTFLVMAIWRRNIALVSILCLVQFQLGGGSLVFTPLLVITIMLCVWSKKPARVSDNRDSGDIQYAPPRYA